MADMPRTSDAGDDGLPMLVADIGGTHARFARVARDGRPVDSRTYRVAGFAGPGDAIEAYLRDSDGPRPLAVALAMATPILSDQVRLTNAAWHFSISALQSSMRLRRLRVINDFTALAWAVPGLAADDSVPVGGGQPVADAPLALIGPGTGLGVSGLLRGPDGYLPMSGEGGHTSLSPADPREAAILQCAWQHYPHVSTERLVSGMGLPLLHRLVAQVDGLATPDGEWTPARISDLALAGDPACAATLNTFCAMLGTAASNLALTLGARGGVFIGGGIVPRILPFFQASAFRSRFEAKGRFGEYLARIPTRVIVASDLALLGAARALMRA